VGTAYSYTGPTVAGGSGGNVFGRLGSYPPGLSFTSSNGALSGTPTTSGVYSGLTIAVSDSVGGAASLATFTITVTAAGGSNPGKLDLSNPASVTGLLTVF
jgi:hypothetical protein